jgi:hypothetical protein
VGEFVRQEFSSRVSVGRVSSKAEYNVLPNSVGFSVHGVRRFCGPGIRVNPNAAEVAPRIARRGGSAQGALRHPLGLMFELIVRGADG